MKISMKMAHPHYGGFESPDDHGAITVHYCLADGLYTLQQDDDFIVFLPEHLSKIVEFINLTKELDCNVDK